MIARRNLSDNDQSDDRMLARTATMWSLKTHSSRKFILKKKSASLPELSDAIHQARCPSMVIHLTGKARSVSAMDQHVNAIRGNVPRDRGALSWNILPIGKT